MSPDGAAAKPAHPLRDGVSAAADVIEGLKDGVQSLSQSILGLPYAECSPEQENTPARKRSGRFRVCGPAMDDTPTARRSVILAVDDDEDDIELLRILFRKAGITHPLQIHRQGEELIAVLSGLLKRTVQVALPLLCFLDVKMPTVTGHELLEWIRQHPQFDSVAVVMLSSSEHPADLKRAAERGAQCYVAKYPHPAVLRSIVDEAERLARQGAVSASFELPANLLRRAVN